MNLCGLAGSVHQGEGKTKNFLLSSSSITACSSEEKTENTAIGEETYFYSITGLDWAGRRSLPIRICCHACNRKGKLPLGKYKIVPFGVLSGRCPDSRDQMSLSGLEWTLNTLA